PAIFPRTKHAVFSPFSKPANAVLPVPCDVLAELRRSRRRKNENVRRRRRTSRHHLRRSRGGGAGGDRELAFDHRRGGGRDLGNPRAAALVGAFAPCGPFPGGRGGNRRL